MKGSSARRGDLKAIISMYSAKLYTISRVG